MSLQRSCFGIAAVIAMGWCVTASADLTGQYLFEEGSGPSALDTSGFGRNGAEQNSPAYVAGLYPGSSFALQLNSTGPGSPNLGAAQSVVLPANTDFVRNASGATLMAWIRMDGGSGDRTLVSIVNGGNNTAQPRAKLEVGIFNGAPHLEVAGSRIDGSVSNGHFSQASLNIGQTYFVAGVLDFVNSTMTVYINGNQDSQSGVQNWAGTSSDTANKFAALGAVAPPSQFTPEYWPGAVDGVRIFDQALTADQIMNLYLHPDAVPLLPEPGTIGLAGAAVWGLVAAWARRRYA